MDGRWRKLDRYMVEVRHPPIERDPHGRAFRWFEPHPQPQWTLRLVPRGGYTRTYSAEPINTTLRTDEECRRFSVAFDVYKVASHS
jgi:hypothetical protein